MTPNYEQAKKKIDTFTNKGAIIARFVRYLIGIRSISTARNSNITLTRPFSVKLSVLTMLFLGSLSYSAQAANWYVRPDGSTYGNSSGNSWTNAWSEFSSISWASVACGDTIWIAGGTYTQDLSPRKNCTSGSQLYIRRARSDASECTSTAGWNSSFDSTVHQTGAGMSFKGNYNYITVSGRTTASGGSNGWWIDYQGLTAGPGIEWPNGSNSSYITIEYMDLQGPGKVTYTADGRGIDDTPFSSATHHTFSHMRIFGWASSAYVAGVDYPVFEYTEWFNNDLINVSQYHPNTIYIIGSANGIVRYSKFHDNNGEGVVFSDGGPWDNWQIYGNLFYNINIGYSKAIAIQRATIVGLKIFNNTFDNNWVNLYLSSAGCDSASQSKNNLIFGTGGAVSCGTSTNNLSTSTNPFVNRSGGDYHIVSNIGSGYPRNAGTDLSTYFTTDMDGVTFGGDGTWDIGAYEFNSKSNSGGVSQSLASPSNLRILP